MLRSYKVRSAGSSKMPLWGDNPPTIFLLEIYQLNRFEDFALESAVLREHFPDISSRAAVELRKKPNIIVKNWSRR